MAWLTLIAGVVIGALSTAVPVVIAWRQRIIQLRDRAADRQRDRIRELEQHERQARVERREHWQPEYDAIWKHLDCGEKLAYRVLHHGPCTGREFDALDVAIFRMNSEILAERGVERLHDPLLALAGKVDELIQNAVPDDKFALVSANGPDVLPHGAQLRMVLRRAVLQDRAARDLAELIKTVRTVLRTEWGD